MKTITQMYIDKYCEYIDRILHFWQTAKDNSDIHAVIRKAEFIHELLGISRQLYDYPAKLIDFNIGDRYYDLNDYAHDKTYCVSLVEQMKLREKRVTECKTLAFKISDPIKDIESGPYNRGAITEEKLSDLLFSLKQIRKNVNAGTIIDESEGREANRLLIEMGFISKWHELGLKHRVLKTSKLPYPEPDPIVNVLSLNGKAHCPQSVKDNIAAWIKKVEHLLSNALKTLSPIAPIPLDERRFLAQDENGQWHKITPKAMFIIKTLNSDPGQAFTGEELKEYKDSDERADKIIQRLPQPIRNRITNTPQHGYHLI